MGGAVGQIEPQRLQGWWRGDLALNTAEVAPSKGAIADRRYGNAWSRCCKRTRRCARFKPASFPRRVRGYVRIPGYYPSQASARACRCALLSTDRLRQSARQRLPVRRAGCRTSCRRAHPGAVQGARPAGLRLSLAASPTPLAQP